jgi:hypothetical protein
MNVIRPPQPVLDKRGEPRVQRFEEQRWLLDNVIRSNGIDWDQPRSLYLNGPCGNEANADFAGIRERVKKMADIGPAFEAVARRREAKAKAAEEAGHAVTARDNYFMAAVHWGAAQWPYDQNDETNIACNNKKRECYLKYAALADHHVEAVWVPLPSGTIPGWLHLPPGYQGGRIPAVIAIHFLQRRSRQLTVSTLFLLQQLQRESEGGNRFERLRSHDVGCVSRDECSHKDEDQPDKKPMSLP